MTMTNQNRPPYNTIPHYIAEKYRGGKLSINQLRLLLWLRAIGTPYGIATTSLIDLKNDVFPDFDLKINTINSMLLKLRHKQHIYFEPRQGKMGTFNIHLNHWLMPKKRYKTLDKFFVEPKQWVDAQDESADRKPYPQANLSEVSQRLNDQNQKLLEVREGLINKFSGNLETHPISSYHNEHDTEHQIENHDSLGKKPSKETLTLVRDFQPKSSDEERCLEIAEDIRDENINPLLALLRTDGLPAIERAWGILKEDRTAGKPIRNQGAYLTEIIKNLRKQR